MFLHPLRILFFFSVLIPLHSALAAPNKEELRAFCNRILGSDFDRRNNFNQSDIPRDLGLQIFPKDPQILNNSMSLKKELPPNLFINSLLTQKPTNLYSNNIEKLLFENFKNLISSKITPNQNTLLRPSEEAPPARSTENTVESYLRSRFLIDLSVKSAAFYPKDFNIPMELAIALSIIDADPILSAKLREIVPAEAGTLAEVIQAAVRDSTISQALAEVCLDIIQSRSEETKQKLAAAKGKTIEVDLLIIGEGLQTQNAMNYLRSFAPDIATFSIEQTDLVASTFAQGGTAFNLNSTSKQPDTRSLRQAFGAGDLNLLPGGLIQVRDLDAKKYPLARSMADAATINRALDLTNSQAILLGTDATEAGTLKFRTQFTTKERQAAYYLKDGTIIQPKVVLVLSGLGETEVPSFLFADYNLAKSRATGDKPSAIMTDGDLDKLIESDKDALRHFSNQDVVVVGAGDTGKAKIRYLIGKSDEEAYAKVTPGPKTIYWSGQECKDCESFTKANRTYYYDIASGYKSGTIQATSRLVAAKALSNGSVEATFEDEFGNRTVKTVKYLIICSGKKSKIDTLLSDVTRPDFKDLISKETNPFSIVSLAVRGAFPANPAIGDPVLGLGKKVKNSNIYIFGATVADIVGPIEQENVPANSVANANHNWRVWMFLDAVVRKIKVDKAAIPFSSRKGIQFSPANERISVELNQTPQPSPISLDLDLDFSKTREKQFRKLPIAGDEVLLKYEIIKILSQFDISSVTTLEFQILCDANQKFSVRFDGKIANQSTQEIIRKLRNSARLQDALKRRFNQSRNMGFTMSVNFRFDTESAAPLIEVNTQYKPNKGFPNLFRSR